MPSRWPTLDTTSADLEVVLSDNGNDATTITFYYGTYRWGNHSRFLGFQSLFQQCLGGHHPCICNRADQRADLLLPCPGQKQLQPKQRGRLGQFLHRLHHRDQFRSGKIPKRCATPTWKAGGNWTATSIDSSGNNRHGTPPIIQTSSLWLDAADTSTNSIQLGSGNVQTWKDKSGNGHDASQSAGGSRPSPVALMV